jgi:hypothetical protein
MKVTIQRFDGYDLPGIKSGLQSYFTETGFWAALNGIRRFFSSPIY